MRYHGNVKKTMELLHKDGVGYIINFDRDSHEVEAEAAKLLTSENKKIIFFSHPGIWFKDQFRDYDEEEFKKMDKVLYQTIELMTYI